VTSHHNPQIAWISLGGTLQSVGHSNLDFDRYGTTGLQKRPGEILDDLGPTMDFVTIAVHEVASNPSHDLSLTDIAEIAQRISRIALSGDADGVVVSCGTNGLEELAFALWLFGLPRVPIVITAAMRPPTALASDAYLNLVDAMAIATAPEAKESGPLIVMNRQVLPPAYAYKMHTDRVDSFQSSQGLLGEIGADGSVRFYGGSIPVSPGFALDTFDSGLPRVDIVYSHLGADGVVIDASVAAGAVAIVCAGMGAGYTTATQSHALSKAVSDGVLVCRSRRTPEGRVIHADEDMLSSESLTPQKARLVLCFALAEGWSRAKIDELFRTF